MELRVEKVLDVSTTLEVIEELYTYAWGTSEGGSALLSKDSVRNVLDDKDDVSSETLEVVQSVLAFLNQKENHDILDVRFSY